MGKYIELCLYGVNSDLCNESLSYDIDPRVPFAGM